VNIAIIGWGSLLWAPKALATRSAWHPDGPRLPIEFARVSSDGRLTLVIHPGSALVQTYWALSALNTLDGARVNLRDREGSKLESIASAVRGQVGSSADATEAAVHEWLVQYPDLDAAIWTGLPATLTGPDVVEQAVAHLEGLRSQPEVHALAREYVVKAPAQTQTAVRQELQKRGWADEV